MENAESHTIEVAGQKTHAFLLMVTAPILIVVQKIHRSGFADNHMKLMTLCAYLMETYHMWKEGPRESLVEKHSADSNVVEMARVFESMKLADYL